MKALLDKQKNEIKRRTLTFEPPANSIVCEEETKGVLLSTIWETAQATEG